MSETNETAQTSNNDKPLKKSHKKHILIGFLVILLIAVGTFIYEVDRLTGSATGVITHAKETITSSDKSYNFMPVKVKGTQVSFSYPAFMSVYSAAQKSAYPILASYEYSYYDIKTWLLTVTITKLNADSLSADSSYYADQLSPSEYSQSTVKINGKNYVVMTNKNALGFYEVAFSLNNGMSAEIALIGNDDLGTANLQKTFNMVLSNFSWN